MKPGYHEIYSRYRDNITRGVLKPGDKVPAIRVLAEELKVARKTVETAYAILTGLIVAVAIATWRRVSG